MALDLNYSIENIFKCQLKKNNNEHILKDARFLPCGYTLCADCIRNEIKTTGKFTCNFEKCNKEHIINDVSKLSKNQSIEELLIQNIEKLTDHLFDKFEKNFITFKNDNTTSDKKNKIESIFELIEYDIVLRVESLKNELDVVLSGLIEATTLLKQKFLCSFDKEYEEKKEKFETFINEMNEKLELEENNFEILKQNMYVFQEYLKELNEFDDNLNAKLNEFAFESSNWTPSSSNIGQINGLNSIDIIAKTVVPDILKLSNILTAAYGLCNIKDEQLIITSPNENKLYVFDKNFDLTKSLPSIGGRVLNKPYGICTDNISNVYLCDYANNRVLLIDEDLNIVRKVIGKQGNGYCEFNGPIDISYYDDCIYVLDERNKRVQQLSKRGEFICKINLTYTCDSTENKPQDLKDPCRINILNDQIIVLSRSKGIFIFNFESQLKQLIETQQISTIFTYDNCLLSFNSDGTLILYDKSNKTNEKYLISRTRKFKQFEFDYSFGCYFNNRLIFSLGDKNKLVAF